MEFSYRRKGNIYNKFYTTYGIMWRFPENFTRVSYRFNINRWHFCCCCRCCCCCWCCVYVACVFIFNTKYRLFMAVVFQFLCTRTNEEPKKKTQKWNHKFRPQFTAQRIVLVGLERTVKAAGLCVWQANNSQFRVLRTKNNNKK